MNKNTDFHFKMVSRHRSVILSFTFLRATVHHKYLKHSYYGSIVCLPIGVYTGM